MKPSGIFYRDDVIDDVKGEKIISFLQKIQEEKWQPNNRGRFPGKIRLRIGYGRDCEENMPIEIRWPSSRSPSTGLGPILAVHVRW